MQVWENWRDALSLLSPRATGTDGFYVATLARV